MTKFDLKSKSDTYREIRKMVYLKATQSHETDHYNANKNLFKSKVLKVCNNSYIEKYLDESSQTQINIWNQLWTKIRYAGIKAATASREINDIACEFDIFENFSKPEWDINIIQDKAKRKPILDYGGKYVHEFLGRTGKFTGKMTVGNLKKLEKIIKLARSYNRHISENKLAIDFVKAQCNIKDVWEVHENLQRIGYTKDLTALHFMMDVGFEVIKPDIVITRLFLHLGWLHDVINGLPADLSMDDLIGKGAYKTKYCYTKAKMYKPVIDLARTIVKATSSEDLDSDIGWSTNNPLREFDIFMVKYGQEPDPNWGITLNLFKQSDGNIPIKSKCISHS